MPLYLVIEGMLIGIVVAVPVGPLGLLCINRALMMGPVCGLFSGLGVATADALAAGIAALGISLISGFVAEQQHWLRPWLKWWKAIHLHPLIMSMNWTIRLKQNCKKLCSAYTAVWASNFRLKHKVN